MHLESSVSAVITGGADSLCQFTVRGFMALESVASERCNPFSAHRHGINIGEGAALFLMTREPGPVRLAGWGETSDAHHVSAPEPEGHGAIAAIGHALARAGLTAADIDYVNLHGTATPQNDAMESRAVSTALGTDVPVSSTKPLTGHTLGAAGAVEAIFSIQAIRDNVAPPTLNLENPSRETAIDRVAKVAQQRRIDVALSNSFGFGGTNASVVFRRAP